ncbi:M18 family aminopeptidase [soil metagenome]
MVHAPATDLCSFIDASPSPFHLCQTVAGELVAQGFVQIHEREPWPVDQGRYFLIRGGSLIAWTNEASTAPSNGFRVVGGHTDSPNLRLKQHPDLTSAGWDVVALEPYGGALLNSWLDRDLGLSGRLTVRASGGVEERLVHLNEPLLRVPQLAIHLAEDRKGVELNPQRHLNAVWGLESEADILGLVAGAADVHRNDVLGFELMTHDVNPSALIGPRRDLVSAPRLDNQGTCFAGLRALVAATLAPASGTIAMLALFDHEEVGSMSDRGAFSDLLLTAIERIVLAAGGTRDDFHRAIAGSVCASGDMAHATHPNYSDRHEPGHRIVPGGGPVLKVNQNLRYATDAAGAGVFATACEQAGVPLQRYVHRADLPCGSTIGPITAAKTGISTVDVGAPQLAMHSARELMSASDIETYAAALAAFLTPA